MRTRHVSRVPYLVDCARLLALLPEGGARDPAAAVASVGAGSGGRLLRGATREFLRAMRPHGELLNAFLRWNSIRLSDWLVM